MLQRLNKLFILGALVAALAGSAPPAFAGGREALDATEAGRRAHLIKAAFLYNFVRYTDWPNGTFQGSADRLRLCLIGDGPFGSVVEALDGQSVRTRVLAIDRFDSPKEARRCHLLFIGASEESRLPEILEALGGAPTLTVAEMSRFADSGGIIQLVTIANKLRFEINLNAARDAGLKFSSRLLRLARIYLGPFEAAFKN